MPANLQYGLEQLLRLRVDPNKSLEMNWFQALAITTEALNVRFGSVWLFDGARRHLKSRVIYDRQTRQLRENLVLERNDHQAYFKTLEQERAVVASDISASPSTQSFIEYGRVTGVQAMLDAPLFRGGLMIGVVCFEDEAQRPWDEPEVTFAQAASETFVRIIESLDGLHLVQQLATLNAELQASIDRSDEWLLTLDHDLRVSVVNRPFIAFWRSINLSTSVGDAVVPSLCPVSALVAAEAKRAWAGDQITRQVTIGTSGQRRQLTVSIHPVTTARGVERLLVHVEARVIEEPAPIVV